VPPGRVLRFLFSHWARQPWLAGFITAVMVVVTLADIATPIFAGRLVDAVGMADRVAGRAAAISALAWLAGLGLFMVCARQLGFLGLVRFTLRMMAAVKAEGFARVQQFSATWHGESFSGSTVRQILRGAGAIDMLNDVMIFGIIPTAAVLVGASVLLGLHWPAMGLAIAAGGTLYVALTVLLSWRWVAPAAALSNLWDTRVSGALSDAITCNAAVRARSANRPGWIRCWRNGAGARGAPGCAVFPVFRRKARRWCCCSC